MLLPREICEFEVDEIALTGAGVRKNAPAQVSSDSNPAWYFTKHAIRTLTGICQRYSKKICHAVCPMMEQQKIGQGLAQP
jgi:hypothetical protein